MAANYRAEERYLQQFCDLSEWITNELSCRMWPLPVLFAQVSQQSHGEFRKLFGELSTALDQRVAPDAYGCMEAVLACHPALPDGCRHLLSQLGRTLGRYDLEGQLREIMRIHEEAGQMLKKHREGAEDRLRCCQTLGLCAGLALAILLL